MSTKQDVDDTRTLAIINTNLMKKIVPIILFFNLLIHFTSCSKDEKSSNGNSNYVGTYVGNIDTYIDLCSFCNDH